MRKRWIIIGASLIVCVCLMAGALAFARHASAPKPSAPATAQKQTEPVQQKEQKPIEFDKTKYSIDDPTSIWVVVNKKRPLPNEYAPKDLSEYGLRAEASDALSNLLSAANKEGMAMRILSAYRSQSTQARTYNAYVAKDGEAKADTYSARPRYSEHQTGWAADLGNGNCDLEICFGTTTAGKWLKANAASFGFIIRYPDGKTPITGYQYEPWHVRYVGKELASELQKTGQTLEEFFGLPPAPTY